MAATVKDLLAALNRDWIMGEEAARFDERHRAVRREIDREDEAWHKRGVLVAEADSLDYLAAVLAAMAENCAVWLGNPRWGAAEWEAFYKVASPAKIYGEALPPAESAPEIEEANWPGTGKVMIATGGTSGSLRFAIHSLKTLSNAVDSLHRWFDRQPHYSLENLPPHHVSGLMPPLRALLTEGCFAPRAGRSLGETIDSLDTPENYFVSLVPTLLRRGMEDRDLRKSLKKLRGIFLGGAGTDPYTLDKADRQQLPIIPSYGMTETCGMVAALPAEEFLAGWRGGGRALPGVDLRLEQDDATPNRAGRILLRTNALCEGLTDGDMPSERGWFATQDEGYFDLVRNLHVLGRIDRAINTGGEKVDPAEVERALLEVQGVRSVMVRGVPDPEWGQRLVCCYTKNRESLTSKAIEAYLETRLSAPKRPKQYIEVDRLPYDDHGKLDTAKLQEYLQQ
ncbi:MAG: AMP-binding protein [Verrucomicrobiota bacterium]